MTGQRHTHSEHTEIVSLVWCPVQGESVFAYEHAFTQDARLGWEPGFDKIQYLVQGLGHMAFVGIDSIVARIGHIIHRRERQHVSHQRCMIVHADLEMI